MGRSGYTRLDDSSFAELYALRILGSAEPNEIWESVGTNLKRAADSKPYKIGGMIACTSGAVKHTTDDGDSSVTNVERIVAPFEAYVLAIYCAAIMYYIAKQVPPDRDAGEDTEPETTLLDGKVNIQKVQDKLEKETELWVSCKAFALRPALVESLLHQDFGCTSMAWVLQRASQCLEQARCWAQGHQEDCKAYGWPLDIGYAGLLPTAWATYIPVRPDAGPGPRLPVFFSGVT